MYNGRHCTLQDYELLVRETNKLLEVLTVIEIVDQSKELKKYFKLIERFDAEIANKLRLNLSKDGMPVSKMIEILTRYIDELKQNVLVDINEHN